MEYAANAIGIAAVALFVLSYQMKKRRTIVWCNVISRALYVIQYVLLTAFEGAVLDVIGILASVLAQRKDMPFIQKHLKAVIAVVNVLIVTAGILLYENVFSLLPVLGVLLHTGAFWLSDEQKIRRVSFLGSPFWLMYNLISHAYGSALGDAMTMVSLAVAMVRYGRGKKAELHPQNK